MGNVRASKPASEKGTLFSMHFAYLYILMGVCVALVLQISANRCIWSNAMAYSPGEHTLTHTHTIQMTRYWYFGISDGIEVGTNRNRSPPDHRIRLLFSFSIGVWQDCEKHFKWDFFSSGVLHQIHSRRGTLGLSVQLNDAMPPESSFFSD